MSPPWMGSSSERFPGAFSGSTGEAPCDCWLGGTVSFMRFDSEEEEGDPARFGESMSRAQAALVGSISRVVVGKCNGPKLPKSCKYQPSWESESISQCGNPHHPLVYASVHRLS
jgi:hypothetical protein